MVFLKQFCGFKNFGDFFQNDSKISQIYSEIKISKKI